MEFRGWISVPGLQLVDVRTWLALVEQLERRVATYGPILAWEDDAALLILSVSVEVGNTEAVAFDLFNLVAIALETCGLVDLYPAWIEVERTDLAPA